MSVELESIDEGGICTGLSNGTWAAAIAASREFGIDVNWNGYHDPVRYTPDQLRQMADRMEQLGKIASSLRKLADFGGAKLS